jgi:hypothetical protein
MGPDGTTAMDFVSQNFEDLTLWKPVPRTSLVPQGINVTNSDSMAVGGLVVLNDVRTTTTASIVDAVVSASAVLVSVVEAAVIRSTADSSVKSSGGSSFTGKGSSLAVNGVIATNVITMVALALVDRSAVTATAGDLEVVAQALSQVDATRAEQHGQRRADLRGDARLQHDRLEGAERPVQRDRHAAGRRALGGQQPATVTALVRNSGLKATGDTKVLALKRVDHQRRHQQPRVGGRRRLHPAPPRSASASSSRPTWSARRRARGIELSGTIPALALATAAA